MIGVVQYSINYPVKCDSPLHLLFEEVVIAEYGYPAIVGTIAVFGCNSSGYVLNGPSTATCMGNGEWIPDPGQVQCEGNCPCIARLMFNLKVCLLGWPYL